MLMKKLFQSKAVPRGTRTIWRYLGALIILFTFAIGQMWGASEITVKLYVHGGTISADGWSSKSSGTYFQKKVAKNTQFDIPAPTQEGYSFVNWTENEDGTGDSYTTSHSGSGSNITLHAQWLELPYEPTHLIDNKLKVNADWNSKLYTTDATNITGLVDWQVAPGKDRTSNVTDKQTGKSDRTPAVFTTSTKEDDNYMYLSFTIASGKRLKLSAVNIPVFGISANKTTEVEIEDANSTKISVNGTITQDADGNGFGTYDFTNAPYLEGAVTMKMWAYGATSGYRMKTPIYLDGAISDIPAVSAPSISAPDADQAAVYDLNDVIAPLEITASGYPTPTYQWYSNSSASTTGATAIEGAQSASYTPASNVASDLYYYCVASNSQGSATSHYFHVTVNAPAVPTIYTETTALTLTSTTVLTASETFTFSGANLGATDVTLVLASAVDGLTLSESSVTPTAGAIADTEITVSYKSLLDVAETDVNLYLKQGDDILKTIVLTYSSTAGIESLTSISAATTWNWNGAADAAFGTLDQNAMIVLANADVTWDAGFNALAIAGKLQHYYRDSKYAQGHELKFNTTIPGRVTVTFSNTGGKDIARAPRITDVNGSYAPTDEADGSKNTTAKTYTHNVAAGDVLIAGFEMQAGTPANMLRYYKVEFVPTYTIAYAANGGSGTMTDANAYVAGEEVTLLANTFTPASGYVWSAWVATYNDGEEKTLTITDGKFTMPAYPVTVTAQWEDVSKVCKIGDDKYTSLEAALTAIKEGTATGTTIELIQNIDVTAQIEIAAGVTATIDLAGHKIEYTGTSTLPSGVILVHNGASLTINDSSDPDAGSIVAGEKAYAAVALTKAGDSPANPAVLEINGGTFTGNYYAITGHGSRHNTQITINNGTFNATAFEDNNAIYHPQEGTLTINDGSFTGYLSAIEMRAGTLVINGGTFVSTATTYSCNPNGSGTTTVGAAIAIAQHNTQKNISVTINGGTFEGVKAINEANPQGNPAPAVAMSVTDGDFTGEVTTVDVDRFVSGGIFDHEVTNAQCAENYVPKDNGDGTYGVKPKDGVCLIKGNVGNDSFVIDEEASLLSGTTYKNAVKSASTKYPDDETGLVGWKFNSKGAYLGFTLDGTETFQENDVVEAYITYIDGGDKLRVFTDHADAAMLKEGDDLVLGVNKLLLPATSTQTLYLYRSPDGGTYQNWNPRVAYFAVYRPMMPTLTAITIDGRDGEIDALDDKHFSVTIPYESDLAALTVVPTIIRNAPHATTPEAVISNEGAWVIGDNTYRVMDKDGDYTDYTITLDRDVLKHTVSFNTHGGSAVASEEVEHNAYLAAAPTAPTKEDYIFQYWSLTEDGEEVDVTIVQITEDKEFHAVWASDGGIKLIDKTTGAINTTDFITGVTATEVNSEKAAAWNSTQGTFAGINNLGKLVQYNATTTQTKVKVKLYSTNNSPKEVYLHKILEGETTSVVETIAVASNTPVETEFYAFNDSKNRSIYLATNSTDVKILQVKVIESGDALPMFGQAGYSLNLNKGRIASSKDVDMTFEGMSYKISSGYGVIGSTELKVKSADGNPYKMSFAVTSPVTMTITESGANYYVYKVAEPEVKGDANAAGTKEFDLTAGTWIIESATTSEAKFTNIAFALPKCEAPVFENTLADIELCIGEAIPAIDGTATVSDGGAVTYKWYEEGSETVLATTAAYTPAADGSYFVVATNSLAGHQDVSTTSDVINVAHFASVAITTAPEDVYKHTGLGATLSVVAEGKNVTYEWFTCDDALGTNPVAIVPAETGASLSIEHIASGIQYYMVVATDECNTSVSEVAKVEGFDDIALQDVTGDMTWDFSKANDGTAAGSNLCTEKVLVNVAGIVNNSDFKSDNIMATANKFSSGKLQASMIKFHTTVNGVVTVVFSHTGNNKTDGRALVVNGIYQSALSHNQTAMTFSCYVPAGDVVLTSTTGDGGAMLNFTSVDFKVKATPDYSRDVTNNIGTLCVDHNVLAGGFLGATFYQIASRNEQYDYKIDFEEVLPGEELKAGEPYIFKSTTGRIDLYYGETVAAQPVPVRGMIGNYAAGHLDITEENKADILYIAKNKLWTCEDLVGTGLTLNPNRAYIQMSAVPTYADYHNQQPNNAPIRRCLTISGDQAPAVITGVEDLNVGDQPIKVMIDGQLFILRGEKMYDAQGRLVK